MKKIMIMILVGLLILAACSSNGNSSRANEDTTLATVPAEYAGLKNPLRAEASNAGAEVFKTNCQMCHGPQGHGDGPAGQSLDPKPRNLAELQTKVGDDFLFWRISTGKPGTSMVAWKGILTDEQIWQVVSFIRTLR
ncbi:MAG TPA: cytochrome c [Anaerolineales bacterium]|nr:cytochrome c [Anaerolineales bacterium]HLO30717.1 cytochrome c [Anaerolineales bacterium]